MVKFKNIKTGNTVRTENTATIALMEQSPNYIKVTAKNKAADNLMEKPNNSGHTK